MPKYPKRLPGANSYAGTIREGKKVCIVGDSMIQRIKTFEMNRNLKNSSVYKKCYIGGLVEDIEWYMRKVLMEKDVDSVIIHMGTNNLSDRGTNIKSEMDIVNWILKAVNLCEKHEVNNIYVSGITCRPGFQRQIDTINQYLKSATKGMNFTFIDNGNISSDLLWDHVHLNDDGMTILKNNMLGALNTSS